MNTIRTNLLIGAVATGAVCHPVSAATITQTVSNLDWNSAIWGPGPSAPASGNDYVTADGFIVRIPADTSDSTFGGDSLTVVANSRALMKNSNSTSTVNGAFTLDGGRLSLGPNGGAGDNLPGTLDVQSFSVTGNSEIDIGNAGGSITILSTLSGIGNLNLYNANAQIEDIVSFTGISGYSGAISLGTSGALTLGFGTSSYAFLNSLEIFGTSVLQVNSGQTLTFDAGDLIDPTNGAVPAGTYTGTGLDSLGSNYANNGGTIVVVPEPSGAILTLLGFGGLFFMRRR